MHRRRRAEKNHTRCRQIRPSLELRIPNNVPTRLSKRHKVFLQACDDIGRDPNEITISTLLQYSGDITATINQAEEFENAGVNLGIVSIPKNEDPSVVEKDRRRSSNAIAY